MSCACTTVQTYQFGESGREWGGVWTTTTNDKQKMKMKMNERKKN